MNTNNRKAWYSAEKGDAAKLAFESGMRCIKRDNRRDRYRRMRTLATPGLEAEGEYRVIASAIETVVAKIGKSEVMPIARAAGIRRTRQERAKRLSYWLRGQVMDLGVHRLARKALRDAATYGTGALYPHRGLDNRPAVERVWVGDLGVEENEEENGDVRTLYRTMVIDRAVARKAWPSKAKFIDAATNAFASENRTRVINGDPITVLECWRLTTGGITGRHMLVTSKGTLVDDEYDSKRFPIKFLLWTEDPERYFGVGLAEAMAGEQLALDKISEKIDASFDTNSPKILIDSASDVQTEKITNTPWEVIRYTSTGGGNPPQFITPAAISSDYRMQQETLIDRAYGMHGVSQLSAQSRKPAGLNAAVALETFNDIESERFWPQTKDFEGLVVQVGEGLIEVAEDIATDPKLTDKGKADVLCSTKAEVRMIRYEDARMPSDQRSLEVEPVSQFSATLSGRLQQADTLRQLGIIKDPDQALELLDDPNLRKFRSLESSARYVIEVQVERCLAGKRQTPDATMPLEYAMRHATQMLHQAILEAGEEEDEDDELEIGMAMLRDYLADVQTLQDQMLEKAAAAMPMPAPVGPPGAAPMPPPGVNPASG